MWFIYVIIDVNTQFLREVEEPVGVLDHEGDGAAEQLVVGLQHLGRQLPRAQDVGREQSAEVLRVHPVLGLVPRHGRQEGEQVLEQREVHVGDELEQELDTRHLPGDHRLFLLLLATCLLPPQSRHLRRVEVKLNSKEAK